MSLLSRTATVRRRTKTGTKDNHGNDEWSVSSHDYPAYLEQTAQQEITIGRDMEISDHLLVLPPTAIIDGKDDVEVDGLFYVVVGPPAPLYTPRGLHHYEVRLRKVTG